MNISTLLRQHKVQALVVIIASLVPWIMYGFLGPYSDATFHLETAAGKYGLFPLDFIHLLYTCAPPLFITPLLFIVRDHWFYWLGSMIMAGTSVLFAVMGWSILSRLCTHRSVAFIGAFLLAVHPFLHQLHFYWMTELAYAVPLVIGLWTLSASLPEGRWQGVAAASAWMMLSRLMRPQADIGFMVGAILILVVSRNVPSRGRLLAVWILVALGLSMPFRILNRIEHHTWLLTKSKGNADGFYLQMQNGSYNENNGPASRKLWDWCTDLKRDSTQARFPHMAQNILEENVRECINIHDKHYMDYGAPRAVYYIFTNDWQAADEFVTTVKREAIRADPWRYWRWATKHGRWYLFSASENPEEWQDTFRDAALSRRERPFIFQSTLGIHQTRYWGGIATNHPRVSKAYTLFRTAFHRTITRLKRLTIYLVPLMLWMTYRRRSREMLYFLAACVGTHVLTSYALGSMTGFHHRYAVPLEVFTIVYITFWLDEAVGYVRRRKERPIS